RPRDTGQARPETSWTRDACDRCRGTSCTTWSYRVPAPAFPTTANRNTSHLAVGVTLAGSGIYTDRYARLARWHLSCNPVGRFPSPRLRQPRRGAAFDLADFRLRLPLSIQPVSRDSH